ncbi:nitrilase-related carbon-nitrogen hydrolase [Aureimonas mangrovi]|uniref:nitrilase-related carbon-nitrogen hydrolase n=1 Tax=Aureimonas mangrovi TaxID=2758041 RepID=UPI00163D77CC|nr:nitrilase-related carbon-nitrogen hydrolase [Aureimonas mangrovi]
MRLAIVQMDAALGGEARAADIAGRIAEAAEAGADLVLFPELAVEGYGAAEAIACAAPAQEDLPASPLQRLVEKHDVAIVAGMAVHAANGSLTNAAVLFRPGKAPLVYAKRRLYGAYEHGLFAAGDSPAPAVAWRGVTLGLLVCFDVEFPELVRELALAGADLVLVPTALPQSAGAAFIARSLVPTRAFENGVFLAYADHCGRDGQFAYQGLSVITAPNGCELARASETEPALLMATIEPQAHAETQHANPYLDIMRGL